MDTARQLVRWALPGWVATLFFLLFITFSLLINGQGQELTLEQGSFLSKGSELIVPLGVAAIPIGYIIYAAYFWIYFTLPLPRTLFRRGIRPIDRGGRILSDVEHIDWKGIFGRSLGKASETPYLERGLLGLNIRFKSVPVIRQYQRNWELSESAWYLALSDKKYVAIASFLY
jgi:hypothetical protein